MVGFVVEPDLEAIGAIAKQHAGDQTIAEYDRHLASVACMDHVLAAAFGVVEVGIGIVVVAVSGIVSHNR